MNKAPQPAGPPPAPSPGLPQPAFPPGQTAPVVFSTPQATQMNTPSQPRQVRGFRCPSPPPGAQRYIIYKVLKFGVSWGGHHCLPWGPFLFSENHSWDCRPRCWGRMPQPLHHPCCCLGRGKGGHGACNY
uniref:Eukaryotic translation initiation factor 4 gamma 1 n=1 Tax=Molossus molossus TaxID=27622 RepID=A0A7J8HYT3_MOLMO|nr:eukaryotic translation initiation factor 4 gamma 1 [Molossus molossus]